MCISIERESAKDLISNGYSNEILSLFDVTMATICIYLIQNIAKQGCQHVTNLKIWSNGKFQSITVILS